MSSSKQKKVRFDEKKQEKKYKRQESNSNSEDDDGEDELRSDDESERKKIKHSLDSDEEDNADNYVKLKRDVLNGTNDSNLLSDFNSQPLEH
jgi:hypothetical protein